MPFVNMPIMRLVLAPGFPGDASATAFKFPCSC